MKFCQKCGKPEPNDGVFYCSACGAKFPDPSMPANRQYERSTTNYNQPVVYTNPYPTEGRYDEKAAMEKADKVGRLTLIMGIASCALPVLSIILFIATRSSALCVILNILAFLTGVASIITWFFAYRISPGFNGKGLSGMIIGISGMVLSGVALVFLLTFSLFTTEYYTFLIR